jgi:drug/metabolite transporter (DMT)-like permease
MVGVITLLGFDVGGDEQRLLGAGFVLLATASYAAAALSMKRPTIAALPSLGIVTAECFISTLVLAPLALTRLPVHIPSSNVLISLLILGLICTALAYLLFFALVAEVGASRGIVFTYVNPAISVLLGVAVLGEPLTLFTIAGFALIVIGSWLSTGGALSLPMAKVRQG